MENDIKFLRIQNFKSIKDITLHPRRVNLIIGEPNVGKSNLLEAMTLLGGITYEQTEKFMGSFIRYEEPRQLFYDNLVGNTIKVETDRDVAALFFNKDTMLFEFLLCNADNYKEIIKSFPGPIKTSLPLSTEIKIMMNWFSNERETGTKNNKPALRFSLIEFDADTLPRTSKKARGMRWLGKRLNTFFRAYTFQKKAAINGNSGTEFLSIPHGENLIEVIQTHSKLRKEIAQMFERYGQKLRIDERRLEIIKDQDGIIYSYPYSSVADTLQRIIFYLAAIESNDDAVLLFEEPEAHSFPVYVSKLGRRIVESRNNQFFSDTHSPYLITEILETMLPDDGQAGELAMFAAYYEDHQTKVHQLSDEEIRSIRADGIDVFYNMKRFTTGAADA